MDGRRGCLGLLEITCRENGEEKRPSESAKHSPWRGPLWSNNSQGGAELREKLRRQATAGVGDMRIHLRNVTEEGSGAEGEVRGSREHHANLEKVGRINAQRRSVYVSPGQPVVGAGRKLAPD